MSIILALLSIFALCTAKPTNVGHGLVSAPIAVATPAVSYSPVTVNSGISQQSRVDYSTPVVANVVSSPVIAAAPVSIAVAATPVTSVVAGPALVAGASTGLGYGSPGNGLGYLGTGGGLGVGGYGSGAGYGILGLSHWIINLKRSCFFTIK